VFVDFDFFFFDFFSIFGVALVSDEISSCFAGVDIVELLGENGNEEEGIVV